MNTAIGLGLIVAGIVIIIIFVFRDRLSVLSFDGSKAKMEAKMEPKISEVEDEPPTGVVFKGNKLRGEGEYRMKGANFSDNDVDGKQKVELGYDDPSSDVQGKEN
ncbi:MAG: hypothetical protein AAGL08_08350 [Cyanobacteria bacterium J06573_11]